MDYLVVAFYQFQPIQNPSQEVKRWKAFFASLDAKGRIYLSSEGVNAQMSLLASEMETFQEWLKTEYPEAELKIDPHHEHAFAKMTIKVREQLAALDRKVDLSKGGEYLSSDAWAKMLEERDEDTLVLDVRNDYEWEVGHFEGAEKPQMQTFREFPQFAKALSEKRDVKKTKVMMYCTGGIRCELYSCLMKEEGFEQVYQLEGGVIKYGQTKGNQHWKGNLFVFDDRLVTAIAGEKNAPISHCTFCNCAIDTYYNCAHMDCNKLFISCIDCAIQMKGCCSSACIDQPRRRPFEPKKQPKPFRKLSVEQKSALKDPSSCQ